MEKVCGNENIINTIIIRHTYTKQKQNKQPIDSKKRKKHTRMKTVKKGKLIIVQLNELLYKLLILVYVKVSFTKTSRK